jgi:hypothetical protein
MKIKIIFIKNDGRVDKDKSPVELKLDYNNRYIVQKGHFITLDNKDYNILAVKGVFEDAEDAELVKIIAKVQQDIF